MERDVQEHQGRSRDAEGCQGVATNRVDLPCPYPCAKPGPHAADDKIDDLSRTRPRPAFRCRGEQYAYHLLSVDAPVLGRKPGEQAAVPAFKRGYILHAATPASGGVDWRLDRLAATKTRPARAAGATYRPNIAAMKLIEQKSTFANDSSETEKADPGMATNS